MTEPVDAQDETLPPTPTPRSQKLWAFLLVVDSIFVLFFGGAIARETYHYWNTPASAVMPQNHRPITASHEAPKSEVAQTSSTVAAVKIAEVPPKVVETKPAPTPVPVPLPKPSLAPTPMKAVPVNFALSAPRAKKVLLVGAFITHGGGKKAMVRGDGGRWTLTLYLTPGTYRYTFLVDGKKKLDPTRKTTSRGASVVAVP